ncbi:biotin--[acetyl-CoA-carboxylase] ligase [Psychroserpens damuponensis]|uniref:biotin--[acetyl-CoA-carboxylase] ligase n=1 Tax=Psychroserpens damuponensis TaxID=943936 RepID=UPI00058FE0CF|nr:biotin--[acetyl-CoA-carboxylase] ligase [Psychroserpens damuponensis]
MHIIKLSAIDSTNTFLRQLSSKKKVPNYTVVVAESQLKGRGQMGTTWDSQSGKNLMASVFVDVSHLTIDYSFWISMVTSLALSHTLKDFQIRNVKIKWPNDILADQKKISGILIENVIKNNALQATIIGIGLNINQVHFANLPLASSMLNVSGTHFNIDNVLLKVIERLKYYMSLLKEQRFEELKKLYETELFRKEKPSTFKDVEGVLFSGFIKGVSNSGHLQVLLEDHILKEFDLKQIQLLY